MRKRLCEDTGEDTGDDIGEDTGGDTGEETGCSHHNFIFKLRNVYDAVMRLK